MPRLLGEGTPAHSARGGLGRGRSQERRRSRSRSRSRSRERVDLLSRADVLERRRVAPGGNRARSGHAVERIPASPVTAPVAADVATRSEHAGRQYERLTNDEPDEDLDGGNAKMSMAPARARKLARGNSGGTSDEEDSGGNAGRSMPMSAGGNAKMTYQYVAPSGDGCTSDDSEEPARGVATTARADEPGEDLVGGNTRFTEAPTVRELNLAHSRETQRGTERHRETQRDRDFKRSSMRTRSFRFLSCVQRTCPV